MKMVGTLSDADQAAFEYAQQWFFYHAGQRYKSFQLFAAVASILLGSGALSLVQDNSVYGFFLGLFGAWTSLIFLRFDRRNSRLVYLGEDVLSAFELKLFAEPIREATHAGPDAESGQIEKNLFAPPGVLIRDTLETQDDLIRRVFRREKMSKFRIITDDAVQAGSNPSGAGPKGRFLHWTDNVEPECGECLRALFGRRQFAEHSVLYPLLYQGFIVAFVIIAAWSLASMISGSTFVATWQHAVITGGALIALVMFKCYADALNRVASKSPYERR